jgi:hypothetical protein
MRSPSSATMIMAAVALTVAVGLPCAQPARAMRENKPAVAVTVDATVDPAPGPGREFGRSHNRRSARLRRHHSRRYLARHHGIIEAQ